MDWSALRAEFPVTQHWAFFDHAAVAPLPACARDAYHRWSNDMADNGVVGTARWLDHMEVVRRRVGQLLNADPLDIAFVKNTSEGIGLIAEGFPWRDGDNVVTAEDEYPANLYPWMNLASRGVEVRRVKSHEGRIGVDGLIAAMDTKTRLLTISHVEFATGFCNDLATLAQVCRERDVRFFVDAIQGLGVLPTDVQALGIDYLAADGHKWLLGPEGEGILFVRRDRIDELRPVGVGWHSVVGRWDFSRIDYTLQPNAGRYESGTHNLGGIAALGASVEWILGVGVESLRDRIFALTDRLCEGCERVGWRIYSSRAESERSGIVSLITPQGHDPIAVMRHLRKRKVVVNVRAGRLRVSPHAYNSFDEIDHLVTLLGEASWAN